MGCVQSTQKILDKFAIFLENLFSEPIPQPSKVYFQGTSSKKSSFANLSDRHSDTEQNRERSNSDSGRRRSTVEFSNANMLLDASKRRNTLATDYHQKHQLQFLAIYNSQLISISKGEDFGLGSIIISLKFDIRSNQLDVHIKEAKNLPAIDTGGECDPYIKIYVYPGTFDILKTNIFYKTRNPKFNATKTFKGIMDTDLVNMIINFELFDWNRLQKDRIIGEVNYPLNTLAACKVKGNKKEIEFERNITPTMNSDNFLGLLLVSLYLDIQKQQLVVSILKGKDLKPMDRNHLSDPYCTIKLCTSVKQLGSKKTSVKYKTVNPIWNESFSFHVTQKDFTKDISLRIKVFDKDMVGREVIGELNFSSKGPLIETIHWKTMLKTQRKPIAEWHSIKPCH